MTRERLEKPEPNPQRSRETQRSPSPVAGSKASKASKPPNQTPRSPALRIPSAAQLEAIQQRRAHELQHLTQLEAKRQLEVTARGRAARMQSKLELRRTDRAQPIQALSEREAKPLAGEARGDQLNQESSAQLQADERQARLEAQQRAFEVSRQLEIEGRALQITELERERRMGFANQQAIAVGTGQPANASGLGGVISALPTEERMEVLQGIRDQHPGTWAKLETLPLVRWDEEWQARVAAERANLSSPAFQSEPNLEQQSEQTTPSSATELASIEPTGLPGGEAQTLESNQQPTAEAVRYAEMLRRAFNIYVKSPVPPPQMSAAAKEEFQQLVNTVLDANAFRAALDALEPTYPELKRAEVLRVLMSLSTQRTRMTVQTLGGIEQITFDGFVEQLSSFMAYSNTLDFSDLNNPKDAKSGAAKILQSFGYKATPAIHGAWGLQMMIFTPVPNKAKYAQTILAFRGTEAVKMPATPAVNAATSRGDPNAFRKDNESELDTATDFGDADIAYTQFDTNRALIADAVKNASRGGSTVIAGHSLGGALAQITAARFPVFQQLLTFQAPHVKAEDVNRLEAQKKLRSMNYRMNLDAVPRGGPQARMAGEIAVFEDQNTSLGTPFASHHTPMLAELLEQTKAEGVRLTPQQAALVDNGKQPPNELSNPDGNANTVRLQQLIPGAEDKTVVAQTSAVFASQNQNAVANNLLFNVMRELLLPDLEKLTSASIRKSGGARTLLERLDRWRGRIGQQEFVDEARARAFSSASQSILNAYGKSAEVFALSADAIRQHLKFTPSQPEGARKILEIALWWKTGRDSEAVKEIVRTSILMARQDLGRWWYSVNLDGEDLYRQVKNSEADPRYL